MNRGGVGRFQPVAAVKTPWQPGPGAAIRRLGWGLIALVAGLALLASAAEEAQADRPFAPRFSQNVQGTITIAANTLLTCPTSDSRCAAARAGTGSALNNNNFNMTYVDVDSDPSTFNSSSATATVPTDAQVLFAGLYYGGRTSAGTGGKQSPNPSARGTVLLRTPTDSAYQTLTAAVDQTSGSTYAAFVDVTSQVQAAGSGSYTVANVQAGTGEDRGSGWSIVIAYRDSAEPARNLTIFDGLESVSQSETKTIGVSGFQTPAVGQVKTELGFVTYEGDRGLTGDSATLDGTVLSSATNPPTNFFNSSISKNGTPVTDKDPDYNNQLGFDAVRVNADGILANGATSAAIRLQTTKDVFLPQVVTFATELFSPTVSATKSVTNVTAPGQAPQTGDVLRYTVAYANSGSDGATQFTAEDAIPVGTTYVPGSLRITAGPNAPASPTDAIGDDLAEYLPAPQSVRFRLGQGANQTTGGLLTAAGGPASSATITFEVAVNGGLSSGTEIANEATGSFLSQTLGTEQSVKSNEVVLLVRAPDLVMSKDHPDPPPGGPVTFNLGVGNAGSAPSSGSVTVTDSFPAAAFSGITITSAPGWNCSATVGLNLSCTRSDALPVGDDYPQIVVEAALVGSPPATFSNTAEVTGGGDPNPTNNVATDYLPAPPATADLAVSKVVDQASVAAGSRVTWKITARNNGPSTATGVELTDSLPAGANTDATATTGQGTCSIAPGPEVQCSIGTLAAGESVEITVSATVTATSGPIVNTAEIEGDEPDTRPNNNTGTATFDGAGTADLSIVKTAGADPTAGEPFTYTITVTNGGPQAAPDLVVNDQVPALFTPTAVTAPGFNCGSLPPAGGTLECLYTGSLAPGTTVTIELTGDLALASAGVNLINTATVSSSLADPDPEDDSSSVDITPLPFADISMSKTASANEVKVGEAFTWTFEVQNLGPLDADPVVLEDELPSGLSVISLPPECELQGRSLTCDLGALDPGDSRTFALTVRPGPSLSGQTVANSASVSSPRPDPNSANNSDESSVEISTAKTDLKLKQKVNRKKARSGGKFTFKLNVKNETNSSAYDSVVCQKLPRNFRVVKAPGAKVGPGRKVCWQIDRLDPGKSRNYSVTLRGFSKKPASFRAPATLTGENITDQDKEKTVRIVVPKKRPVPPRPVTG